MNPILYKKEGPIAWLLFNDPERLNALSEEMGKEIERLVAGINKDPSIRVVILSGEGRAFSAGGNLDIIIARTQKKAAINQREMIAFYRRFLSILKIKAPVIAMINGHAIGAAFCMTLACDFRIAASTARLGVNFVKIGLSPGMGGTFLLPQILGIPLAMDLLLTGRTLSAEEALQKGIVHQVHSPENLKEETLKLAQEICANAPVAVKIAKQGIHASLHALQKSLQFESKGQAVCFKTKDISEGIEAIRAKRTPQFSGK
ncbi:MAG: enoyl-CoA hydratase/isomerase family protein [Deltaproteobacteria bacterium]|nr:enoyl-CoA hydratase/isomerase family protein [Deltaproteobacteria bacterium]